jgi:hypothetical protein
MDAETNHLPETYRDEDVLMGLLGDKAGADDNADIRSESSISSYGDDDDTVVTTSETKSLSSTSLEVLPNESLSVAPSFRNTGKQQILPVHMVNPTPQFNARNHQNVVSRYPQFRLYAEHETKEDLGVSVNTYERSLENCETSRSVREERDRKHWRPYEIRPLSFLVLLATDISALRIATTTFHSVGLRTP